MDIGYVMCTSICTLYDIPYSEWGPPIRYYDWKSLRETTDWKNHSFPFFHFEYERLSHFFPRIISYTFCSTRRRKTIFATENKKKMLDLFMTLLFIAFHRIWDDLMEKIPKLAQAKMKRFVNAIRVKRIDCFKCIDFLTVGSKGKYFLRFIALFARWYEKSTNI